MKQNKFEFGATIETALNVPRVHFRALLRAAVWPAVAAIPGLGIYFTTVYLMVLSGSGEATGGNVSALPAGVIFASWVGIIPMLLIGVAFTYNWQRFVMNGEYSGGSTEIGTPYSPPDWWDGYKASLVKATQLFLLFMVPYLILFWDLFTTIPAGQSRTIPTEEVWGMFGPFAVWFVVVIIAMPYFLRASLVFPAIAAGIPDATFKNALAVSKGMGWRMVGTYLVGAFALMVMLMLGMIAFAIAAAIVGGLASLISPNIAAVIFVPLGLVFYVGIYLYMSAFYAGFPATVLIQILPDFHDRWNELSGKAPSEPTPPPSEEFTLSSYGKKKDED